MPHTTFIATANLQMPFPRWGFELQKKKNTHTHTATNAQETVQNTGNKKIQSVIFYILLMF